MDMDLKSLSFAWFILPFLAVYFLLCRCRLQKWLILAVSLIVIWNKGGLFAIAAALLVCAAVWGLAKEIDRANERGGKNTVWLFRLGIAIDLGALLFFKFFTGIFENLLSALTEPGGDFAFELAAPMGIAYFSLSIAGYLYDVYHKKLKAEGNFFCFLLYALYFPALLEGPFNLYKNLMPKLKAQHSFDYDRCIDGLQRILWGYFKKMVIADRIGVFVTAVLGNEAADGLLLFFAMALYSFQIYGDFSGGIDIMMGISRIMGIDLEENFRAPFTARSVTQYWQRWHMTLGTIMEKYLYYPIVFSKRVRRLSKKIRSKYMSRVFGASLATFIVFVIVGIWHGTGWNYVVYGIYQAIFTSFAVLLGPAYKRVKAKVGLKEENPLWKGFCIVRTFVILTFGRYLIKAATLSSALDMYKKTFRLHGDNLWQSEWLTRYGLKERNWTVLAISIVLLLAVDVLNERGICVREKIRSMPAPLRFAIYYAGLFAIIICGVYGAGYDASSFIYAQF